MTKLHTHYDNLKVSRDAPDFVIRATYKTLSQKYHPDKHPSDEHATRVMSIINQSYEILSDPARRREHDAWIAREELKYRRQEQPPQSSPVPPQWQQQPQAPSQPETRNWFLTLLLLPFKLVIGIFRAVPQLALLALLIGGFWLWDALTPDRPPPAGPKPYQAQAPVKSAPAPVRPVYTRPASAPNGSPWPSKAAYVKGYPIDNDSGYSDVTVDNAQNDADVFVKLVSLGGVAAFPVRQFYIPAGSRFKMNKVSAGKYDIRYRDLKTGGLSRSEAFDVEEERTADGVQYSTMTMTLYKVAAGNFQTYDLADSEF